MNNFKKAFAEVKAPEFLYRAVLLRISALERRTARMHTALFSVLSIVFLVASVPALQYAGQQFYASGFYDYLALLFSDSSLVLTYWREFGLSLMESLPSLALLLLIPIVAMLLWSLKRTAQTARIAFA
jgi:hypothetical protein